WSEPVTSQQHAPYAIPSHHWRSSFQRKDQMHVNMETKQKPLERTMKINRQDETLGSWFKIIIPFGIKYDEKWLMNLIQKKCSVPFTAVEFHYEKMQAQFFVEKANVACALKNVNGQIFNEDNEKISIFVEPCDAPQSVQKALTAEKLEQIKVMQTQHKLYLTPCDIGMPWNCRNSLAAFPHVHPGIRPMLSSLYLSNKKPYLVHGLSTIMELASATKKLNLSNTEVKIAGEMDKGHQLEPEGMSADRNAVCTTFRDKSANMRSSSALSLHPDGQETPSGSKCAMEAPKCLPMCKGSFFGSEELKSLILQFLQQYYLIHDYGNRQGLLGAYHEEACFSLTIPFQPEDPALSSMCAYFLDNRNMKTLKDPNLRVQLLKHTKHDIVHAFCALPKTQHDFSSFVVDMCFQTEKMLCFSVNGVFKEGMCRSFPPTWIPSTRTLPVSLQYTPLHSPFLSSPPLQPSSLPTRSSRKG
uniref:NTF2 domain-containing protein n=1 Tax=Capra hircus TaxID=9925 RepID=A0A452F4S8_CAPHI